MAHDSRLADERTLNFEYQHDGIRANHSLAIIDFVFDAPDGNTKGKLDFGAAL